MIRFFVRILILSFAAAMPAVAQDWPTKPVRFVVPFPPGGSLGQLAMILVQQATGTKMTHVPYKGGGPMMADAMGGQIELGVASVAALAANVRGGKLRAVATTGDKRSHTMPDVPTLQEQGLK